MFEAVDSPYLVPFDGSFRVRKAPCALPKDAPEKKERQLRLKDLVEELSEQQRMLYAHDSHALLLVFQAMDAAGKDSTIRAVLTGVDPSGCEMFSFKRPSPTELDHDFLWRTALNLPERGRIGVFNRSYYEEVLVVRVHPDYLRSQKLPYEVKKRHFWKDRYESIRDHEKHLARNGTVILKFWLNVSQEEQRRRFLSRLDEPEKNWKFEAADIQERELWPKYMKAYQDALNATAKAHAPWYAIPADSKSFMQMTVADIVVRSMKSLGLHYPVLEEQERVKFAEMRRALG